MATAIGDLVARLRMDTAGFNRGAAGSIGALGRMRAAAVSTMASIRGIGGSLAALVGIGGMGYMIKQQLAGLDALAKTSRQIGIEADELVGLRHAAELTGAGAEAMEKGMQKLSKGLGEAVMGAGTAKDALDELELSADKLSRQPLSDSLGEIVEALSREENLTKRNALATALFGRAGQQLVLTLGAGKEALHGMVQEGRDLFGRHDTSRIEEANDAISRMKLSFQGFAASAAVDLAPVIETLANMTRGLDDVGGAAENTEKKVGVLGIAGDALLDAPVHLYRLWNAWVVLVGEAIAKIYELGAAEADLLAKGMLISEEKRKKVHDKAAQAREEVERYKLIHYTELQRPLPSEAARTLADTRAEADRMARRNALDQQGALGGSAAEAADKLDDLAKTAEDMNKEFRSPWAILTDRLDEIEALRGAGLTPSAVEKAKAQAIEQFKRAGDGDKTQTGGSRFFGGGLWDPFGEDKMPFGEDKMPTVGGPRFAGAMEKGSQEAYSTIVQAGKGGEQIGKEQLKVQKELLAVNRRILAKREETVNI